MRAAFLCLVAAIAASPAWAAGGGGDARPVDLLRLAGMREAIRCGDAQLTLSAGGADGFRIVFPPGRKPSVDVAAPASAPWDWSGYGGLAVDVTNPGRQTVMLGMEIRGAGDASLDGRILLAPQATETVLFPFVPAPKSLGMLAVAPVGPFRNVTVLGKEAPAFDRVAGLSFYLPRGVHPLSTLQPSGGVDLSFARLRLVRTPPFGMDQVVDAFGQDARADWPGKVKEAGDFAKTRAEEEADLAANPGPSDRDGYGGWAQGPSLEATGFFRVQKTAGADGGERWSLVDPEGRLFLSAGLYCGGGDRSTFVAGREGMFSWLPKAGEPLAAYRSDRRGSARSGEAFDFYGANLERKYGPGWTAAWRESTRTRLRSWGFNTLTSFAADWHVPDGSPLASWKVPYALVLGAQSGHAVIKIAGGQAVHDPFDPRFRADLAAGIAATAAANRNDPFLIGYFVHNEIRWGLDVPDSKVHYELAYAVLRQAAADSPAKRELLRELKAKYGTPQAFAVAWGTRPASWEALQPPYDLMPSPNAAIIDDLAAFTGTFAEAYFRTVREELRKADPNHLYLGCRDAFWIPEETAAAAKYCDVLSFNVYQDGLPDATAETLRKLGKPCLITEFHCGATDRGLFHGGLVWAPDQAGRADFYSRYVRGLLRHPAIVGWHWYEYLDEPLLGRIWDGENFGHGFVSVADVPYPELVQAARTVNADIYPARFARRESAP